MAYKKEKVDIFGGITIKKGALRRTLKIKKGKKIPMTLLQKLKKIKVGGSFVQGGEKRRMTSLLKKRVNLAIVFKKRRKKRR
tara:strand:- start:573 stop:818 length:246 start_codon:yes stop_codon:yes gene_type:complete